MVLKIYRSSAGSGKTFKLTEEYLKLVFADPFKYQKILAVTFTNKATEEMKNRILTELYKLAQNQPSGHTETLQKTFPNLGDKGISSRAKLILQLILYDYSHFSISTIDSFFQKVVKGFSREIGIQYGYNVELNTQSVLDRAVDQMMLKIGEDKQLNNWLEDFAANRQEQGSSWDLKSSIQKFAGQITKEEFQQNETSLKAKLSEKSFLSAFIKKLSSIVNDFENGMQAIGQEAIDCIKKAGLDISDFSYKESGVAGYFIKISEKLDFIPGTRAKDGLDNTEKWYSKKTEEDIKARITQLVDSSLNGLLHQAFNKLETDYRSFKSAQEVKRYLFMLGILTDISSQLSEIREDENLMLISDVNQLLRKVIDDNDTPFLYEKMGNRYMHFLVDEFQDTSQFQWQNIKPLIKNSLDSNHMNLIVGDIKQSIYRWRGGDWSMLLKGVEQEIGDELIESVSLKENWRSRKNIIDFNNAVFSQGAEWVKNSIENQLKEFDIEIDETVLLSNQQITEAFKDVVQDCPEKENNEGGQVEVRFCRSDKEKGAHWKDDVHQQLELSLDSILENCHQKDITFLVRTKAEANELADFLLAAGKYNILSKEALFINSSPAVRLLISALKFINESADFINAVNLIVAYYDILGHKLHYQELIGLNLEKIKAFLPAEFFSIRLKELSLYDLIERLSSLFKLNEIRHEWAYIQALNDVVLEYSQNQKADLASFLEWWEEFGLEKSIQVPDDLDAMEIMTIHKAKGLDFKVVIIPYLDWSLDHNTTQENILWTFSHVEPFNDFELLPLKYSKKLIPSIYVNEYCQERVAAAMDSLNVLYVALTRAVDSMLIFSKLPEKENSKTVGDLLFNLIKKESTTQNTKLIKLNDFWEEEDAHFTYGSPVLVDENLEVEKTYKLDNYIINTDFLNVRVKHEHADVFDPEKESPAKLNYGKLMHEILAQIKVPSDIEKVINALFTDGILNEKEKISIQSKLSKALSQADVKDWFSGKYKVLNENPILIPNQDYKIPDRVMLDGNKALVVDYKFGAEHASHKLQLAEYKHFLTEMDFKEVEGYLWYVDEGKIVAV
ncbi:MAG: UvrD-helicase domain-containing protein [Bacteroidetes bacterium]|nr:UvrD-helicase domain-containing protein [Bacteroidota bacterium]